MRVGYLLALLLLMPVPSFGAPAYGWPLPENFGVSATFGESRNDHFHAGIDLSTNGETGLPVMAIEAGEVYRLKVQKRGYGRAVYVRHANGMVSVYGHLESYSTELGLEQAYQNKKNETGARYVGDIFLEPPVRVERGAIIAFSGETGAGLPHLHLEIRRGENVPVNPLTNGLEDDRDPTPPVFQAAYLYPASGESPIDGDLEPRVVRFRKGDSGTFITDQVPVVRGDFHVSVSAYDAALRPYHRNPHRIAYSINDKVLYEVEFNEFSYTEPEHFGLIYDLGKPGPAYYEYPIFLSNPVGISLPFSRHIAPVSVRNLPPGNHTIELIAADAMGNTSTGSLHFVVNQPPAVRIEKLETDPLDLVVRLSIEDPDWKISPPSGFAGEIEYSLDDGKTFQAFPLVTMDLQGARDSAHLICRAPLASLGAGRVLLKVRGFDGVEYSPYTVLALARAAAPAVEALAGVPPGEIRLRPFRDAVRVEFNTNEAPTYPLELSYSSRKIPLQSWDLTSYTAVLPAPQTGETFQVSIGDKLQAAIPVHYLRPDQPNTVRGENFELSLDPGALYRPAFVWPESLPPYKTRTLYPVGSLLQLGPRGMALKKAGSLTLRFPAGIANPERLSIYRWSRVRQRWESLPSTVNTTSRSVTTRVSYLDLFALIYDNVPPAVRYIFPKRNSSTTNASPKLAAFVSDAGMDIDDEKVTFYIDGVPHAAEYDPDRNLATVQIEKPLRKGDHRFRVEAYDWGGNRTVSTQVTFRVR